MSPSILKSAMKLSRAEKILLVEQLWDSIAETQDAPPLTAEQEAELKRRLARFKRTGSNGSSWEEVKRRIQKGA